MTEASVEDFVTVPEVAYIKGVTRAAVYTAISEGRLPHEKLLGRIAIRREDVKVWQPVQFQGRDGAKGRGGRPAGRPMTDEAKARLSEAQKERWAAKKLMANGG